MSKNGKWEKDKEALMHDLRRRREIIVEIESLKESLKDIETGIKSFILERRLTEHIEVHWQSLEEIIISTP